MPELYPVWAGGTAYLNCLGQHPTSLKRKRGKDESRAVASGLWGCARSPYEVTAPSCVVSSRYHASARAARPGRAVVPQMSDRVRRVSGPVLVRWASLTAVPQGPSA